MQQFAGIIRVKELKIERRDSSHVNFCGDVSSGVGLKQEGMKAWWNNRENLGKPRVLCRYLYREQDDIRVSAR